MIQINQQQCNGCARCLDVCPEGAIYLVDDRAQIDQSRCTGCGDCIEECPTAAIYRDATEITTPPGVKVQPRESTLLTAIKSVVVTVGTTLLPVIISKIGEALNTKLENKTPQAPSGNKPGRASGKQVRRRYRGGR